MSNIIVSLIASEILGFIFISVLEVYLLKNYKRLSDSSKCFTFCAAALLLSIVADSSSYIFEYYKFNNTLIYIADYFAIVGADIMEITFVYYVYLLAKDNKQTISKNFLYIIWFFCFFDILFNLYGIITGSTFYIENSTFCLGEYCYVYSIIQIVAAIIGAIFVITNRKKLNIRSWFVLLLYYVFPLILSILDMIMPLASFAYTGLTVSYTIIFLEIETRKEQELINKSEIDSLTEVLNRNAYEVTIDRIKDLSEPIYIGVFFCDLNGLKYANDTFGHTAGDNLIIRLAEILKSCFDENKVYRIGGDEFVVILENVNTEYCQTKLDSLMEIVTKENYIASVGFCYGPSIDVDILINKAEAEMYKQKVLNHRNREK